MLLGTLAAYILGNALKGSVIVKAAKGVMRAAQIF